MPIIPYFQVPFCCFVDHWASISETLRENAEHCGKPYLQYYERNISFGELTTPPFAWTNLYAKSRVHPGTYYAIQTFLPKDLASIVFDYVHSMCKGDRLFLIHLQLQNSLLL